MLRQTAAVVVAGRALIVGNTDGIGLALTKRLLGSGWTVVGLSRRASALEAPGYHHGVADVSGDEYRPRLQKLQASHGPFDVCVYCAVDIILRCFRQRPGRMTYPRRMAALAWLLGRFASMKLWFKSPP